MEIKCPDCGNYYPDNNLNCPQCDITNQKITPIIPNKQNIPKLENNELKQCRLCAMMIPKKARVCPYCRKGQGISPNVAAIVIILFTVFIFYIGVNSQTSTQRDPLIGSVPKNVSLNRTELINEIKQLYFKNGIDVYLKSETNNILKIEVLGPRGSGYKFTEIFTKEKINDKVKKVGFSDVRISFEYLK